MSALGPILVLDDDPDVLTAAGLALSRVAPRVKLIARPEEVEPALAETAFEAALLDMNFAPGEHSGGAGLDMLARIQAGKEKRRVVFLG